MSKQWQIRRGTTAENNEFTGAVGELTMDTQTQGLRIHDGTTQGGHMIDTVVAWQVPTADNNYTWYRKYASGWVEQGGYIAAGATSYDDYAITLPVLMADTHYFKQKLFHKGRGDSSGFSWAWLADHRSDGPDDTTSVAYFCIPSDSYVSGLYWQVSGMASA